MRSRLTYSYLRVYNFCHSTHFNHGNGGQLLHFIFQKLLKSCVLRPVPLGYYHSVINLKSRYILEKDSFSSSGLQIEIKLKLTQLLSKNAAYRIKIRLSRGSFWVRGAVNRVSISELLLLERFVGREKKLTKTICLVPASAV